MQYIREIKENLEEEDVTLLEGAKSAAVASCGGYTGMTKEELDEHEDITIVVLTLVSDMWDKRSMTVDQSNINRIAETILGLYAKNLIPSEEED